MQSPSQTGGGTSDSARSPRATTTTTVTVVQHRQADGGEAQHGPEHLQLRLEAAAEADTPAVEEADGPSRPHVQWAQDTVDNEHMGKKKSKCCCIYKKKRNWDESSGSSDEECESKHCRGHVEKKPPPPSGSGGNGDDGGPGPSVPT